MKSGFLGKFTLVSRCLKNECHCRCTTVSHWLYRECSVKMWKMQNIQQCLTREVVYRQDWMTESWNIVCFYELDHIFTGYWNVSCHGISLISFCFWSDSCEWFHSRIHHFFLKTLFLALLQDNLGVPELHAILSIAGSWLLACDSRLKSCSRFPCIELRD